MKKHKKKKNYFVGAQQTTNFFDKWYRKSTPDNMIEKKALRVVFFTECV